MANAGVIYVLARAAEEGIIEAAGAASEAFDPFVRGSIRKAARRAYIEAGELTTIKDEPHVLRVAFLKACGKLAGPPDDVAGVRQAFDAARVFVPKRRRFFWPVTVSSLVVITAAAIATAAVLFFPTPRERFAKSSFGEAMGDGFTDFVVGVGRGDRDREEKGRAVILKSGVKRQIGETAFNLLGTSLEETKAVSAMMPSDAKAETAALTATLHSLDTELEAKKIPGFVDVYRSSSTIWLLGYYVEDRGTITVGSSATIPFVRGRRLDNLNLEVGGKGYESKVLGGWVFSIDEIEEWTARNVVPALGKDRPFAFGASNAHDEGSGGRLDMKAGEKIRADLMTRVSLSPDDGTELADLLAQRHLAFVRLAVLGDELYEPSGITAKIRLKRALARRHDEIDAKEIIRIEDRLSRFEKAFDRIVAAQATLDEMRIAAGTACTSKTCDLTPEAAKTVSSGVSWAIAAHLTMVGRSDATYLALAEAELGAGGYSAVFAIERELGLSPEWLSGYGVRDQAEHNQLGVAAFDKPAADIRKAAESAYEKMFGTPMPVITRSPPAKL